MTVTAANLAAFCNDWCKTRAPDGDRYQRWTVVLLALAVHGTVVATWMSRPDTQVVLPQEISLSIAFREPQQVVAPQSPKPQVRPKPAPRPQPTPQPLIEPEPEPLAETPAQLPEPVTQPEPVLAAEPEPVPAPMVVPDTEPHYRASYLNNPQPTYPRVARRMGYQGTVMLDVEVLADGKAGQIKLRQSCGFPVLDKAALQSVKDWKFVPARHAGEPVTKWFVVPIEFSLEKVEA